MEEAFAPSATKVLDAILKRSEIKLKASDISLSVRPPAKALGSPPLILRGRGMPGWKISPFGCGHCRKELGLDWRSPLGH